MDATTNVHELVEELSAAETCEVSAKWAAVVDDVIVPMPQRVVEVAVLTAQSGAPPESVLVRDHNSPNDFVLPDDGRIDLAQGNVFYRLDRCEVRPRDECKAAAMLAFVANDRAEITVYPDQTGRSIRELFSLPTNSRLFREMQSAQDQVVSCEAIVRFEDGPVFCSRDVDAELKITVNARIFSESDGVRAEMTGLQIAALVYPENSADTRVWFVSDGNREVELTETVFIHECDVFEVVRKQVTGGFRTIPCGA